jgi:hypothetical protein
MDVELNSAFVGGVLLFSHLSGIKLFVIAFIAYSASSASSTRLAYPKTTALR